MSANAPIDPMTLMSAAFYLRRGMELQAEAIATEHGFTIDDVRAELAEMIKQEVAQAAAEAQDVARAVGEVMDRLGARLLTGIDGSMAPPLILDRIDPEGHTILFGPGDVGKGVEASRLIALLSRSGDKVLIIDYEGHEAEWRRRVGGFKGDLTKVLIVQPASPNWGGARGAIWKQAADLSVLRHAFDAGFAFIDSIAAATAGVKDPYSPESPSLYGEALQVIGGHIISLAHSNRSDDMRYPFGSIFWHNFARTTWSLEISDGRRLLTHRKKGNREWAGEYELAFDFDDEAGRIHAHISPWRSGASRERDERLDESIDLVPADGEGKTQVEIQALWGMSDRGTDKRIATLEGQGRMRHEKVLRPTGGYRNLYWSVPMPAVRLVPS